VALITPLHVLEHGLDPPEASAGGRPVIVWAGAVGASGCPLREQEQAWPHPLWHCTRLCQLELQRDLRAKRAEKPDIGLLPFF